MSAVLQLREEMDRLKRRKIDLSLTADAAIRAAREILALAAVTPLQEIDLKTAAAHLTRAVACQDELGDVIAAIRKVERELGV